MTYEPNPGYLHPHIIGGAPTPELTESVIRHMRDHAKEKRIPSLVEGYYLFFYPGRVSQSLWDYARDAGVLVNPSRGDMDKYAPGSLIEMNETARDAQEMAQDAGVEGFYAENVVLTQIEEFEARGWCRRE